VASNVRFEDFELEPDAYRLRQNHVVVRLERIPFELLCLLVERRGEIVTREEILDQVVRNGRRKQVQIILPERGVESVSAANIFAELVFAR
jgi:DNA-binding winged helix-turn-helix (wHTH) protein